MLSAYQRSRVLMTLAVVICFGMFWYLGKRVPIPGMRGFGGSLLLDRQPLLEVAGTWVALGVSVIVGTLIVGRIRVEAGLFAACLGLSALSIRAGSVQSVVMAHPYPGTYLVLAGEVLVLLLGLVGVSYLLRMMEKRGLARHLARAPLDDAARDDAALDDAALRDERQPLALALLSVGVQVVLMSLLVALLVRSTQKAQVLIMVFVSGAIATALGGRFFHRPRLAALTCVGPMLVGVIGYLLAWSDPGLLAIGLVDQPLARALPLDYASAGCAGAILGGWFGAKYELYWVDQVGAALTGTPTPVRGSTA